MSLINVIYEILDAKNLLNFSDFGAYSVNPYNPKSKEENTVFIDKITESLYHVMKDNNFLRINSSKEIFRLMNVDYESNTFVIMRKTKQLEFKTNYKGYMMKKVDGSTFNEFKKFYDKVQIYFSNDNEIYNVVNENILDQYDIYNVYYNNTVVAQFFKFGDNIVEDVFVDKEHRGKGIMKNYINQVFSNQDCYLLCDEDVVDFYKKCGFDILYKYDDYRYVIKDYNEILMKIKDLL